VICGTCGTYVPDGLLSCPKCTITKSKDGFMTLQRALIPAVLEGRIQFNTSRDEAMRWHIMLAGAPKHTWCGMVVASPRYRSKLDVGNLIKVCADCRALFHELVNEVKK